MTSVHIVKESFMADIDENHGIWSMMNGDQKMMYAVDHLVANQHACNLQQKAYDHNWDKYSYLLARNDWDALLFRSKAFERYAYRFVFMSRKGCIYNHRKCKTFFVLRRSYDPEKDDPKFNWTDLGQQQTAMPKNSFINKLFPKGLRKKQKIDFRDYDWTAIDQAIEDDKRSMEERNNDYL